MKKGRVDKILIERGLAETPPKAQAMIMAGLVFGGSGRIEKPGQLIPLDLEITVHKPSPFVSRGGLKLEEALGIFRIEVSGKIGADIGASTGGFTDCLLQRGAARVYAVDVDIRQIDRKLRNDARVVLIEKNARYLVPEDFAGGPLPDFVVMDVSFISVLKIMPALKAVLAERRGGAAAPLAMAGHEAVTSGLLLTLIKPQFEAGRLQVGKKGIVRDPTLQAGVLKKIVGEASALGFKIQGLVRCATRGKAGNQEFFARWSLEGLQPSWETVLQWIKEVTRDESD